MLERQQTQLVSCVQELYRRLRTAGLMEQPHLDGSDRHPLVHDILATLGISKAKSDGGEELETPNYAAESAESDYDAASQGSNNVPEAHKRHDGDIDQLKSPILVCDDTTSISPKGSVPTYHSTAASMLPSPLSQSFQQASETSREIPTHSNIDQRPSAQNEVESSNLRTNVFAASTTLTDGSDFDISNSFPHNNAITPSLFVEPLALEQGYSFAQSTALPTSWPSFCHGWAEVGMGFDSSDFLTDFNNLSPLVHPGTGIHSSSQSQETP
jgi:hypothetical protein